LKRRLYISVVAATLLTVVFWLLDAGIRFFVIGGTFYGQLLTPAADAVLTRLSLLSLSVISVASVNGILQLREARAEAEDERRHVQMLYENTSDAIMFLDRDMRVVYVNPVAARLTGKKLSDAIGLPCYKAILGAESSCAGCRAMEVFESGRSASAVKHELTESGNENWLEQTWYPVTGKDGRIQAVLEVARDITELKLLERESAECRRGEEARRRASEKA
jgi:PAS domain S-box-containing protein